MKKTISLAKLAKHAEQIADDIEQDGTVYRITRAGKRTMVLADVAYFEGWQAALELMQRPGWRSELEQANRELLAGSGRDLEAVLEEMRRERSAQPTRGSSTRGSTSRGRSKGRQRASHSRRRSA